MRIERQWGGNDIGDHPIGSIKLKTTINNTPETIDSIAIANETSVLLIVKASAKRTDTDYTGGFIFEGQFANNDGTLTQVGSTTYTFRQRQQIPLFPKWNSYFLISGTNVLILVKGNNGHTVDWKSYTTKIDR